MRGQHAGSERRRALTFDPAEAAVMRLPIHDTATALVHRL
jgi:hypothetical protein